MGEGNRYAVLLWAKDSEYVTKNYCGFFGVFVEMLGEDGDTWEAFNVAADEFPDDGELSGFDGFMITCSCNDAHGDDAWIRRLLAL